MDVESFSNPESFYIIDDGSGGPEHYFIPNNETICDASSSQESMDATSEDDMSQFFLPKKIKLEKSLEAEVESDSLVVLPSIQLLNDAAVSDIPILEDTFDTSDSEENNGIIIEFMEIQHPLKTLKVQLEKRLNISLEGYTIWLQDAQVLDSNKNLVDQCVQGEGLVQFNCEVKYDSTGGRINIVDVLKPTEEYIKQHCTVSKTVVESKNATEINEEKSETVPEKDDPCNKTCVSWVPDAVFKKEMDKMNISEDPKQWTKVQVKLWLQWAVRKFNLSGIKLNDWSMTGEQLCCMSLSEFKEKVPKDPEDLFWTHLELLRTCRVVAVRKQDEPDQPVQSQPSSSGCSSGSNVRSHIPIRPKVSKILGATQLMSESTICRSGSNGQIQLWQFLLELLTNKDYRDIIQWASSDGEFLLSNPDAVAQLWGIRKKKPTMNYEKLSRALRYYYDGDMIAKVSGKRFVYKFVCDLKALLGYDAHELNSKVIECAMKNGITTSYCNYYEH